MTSPLPQHFAAIVSALVWSLAGEHAAAGGDSALAPPYNDLTAFALAQHGRLPDFLRAPMTAATLAFNWLGGRARPFHQAAPMARARQIAAWRSSPRDFQRDLIRYYESLTLLALYQRTPDEPPASAPPAALGAARPPAEGEAFPIIVIGSGPGGALTACHLAEAGREVLLLEAGDYLPLSSCVPFSRQEMVQKYRHGGQTVALGEDKIAYVEGCCVGGGSEVNSGLYHRPPPAVLEDWRRRFQVADLSEEALRPHSEAVERDLSVSLSTGATPPAAERLRAGAARLGWQAREVPRWYRPPPAATPDAPGERQSMTATYIPRFLRAGGRLLPRTTVRQLARDGAWWRLECVPRPGGPATLFAERVFVSGGAVQTPALLRRSGITQHIGDSLRLHPTAKLVAEFPGPVNHAAMGVPAHQVKDFSPRLSLGCSVSNPAYLALALLEHPTAAHEVAARWTRRAVYYAMITGSGRGSVRPLPGCQAPLVRYAITPSDRRDLADGMHKLGAALLAGGANALYPAVGGGRPATDEAGLAAWPAELPAGRGNLMTIHLFSSCPMGENRALCATDSFGAVHDMPNLWVADAGLLPGAPGVNPQGTIMALARRNVWHFLGRG